MTILATGNSNAMVILDDANNMSGPTLDPRQSMVAEDPVNMLTPSIVPDDELIVDRFKIPFSQEIADGTNFWVHFRWSNPSEFASQAAHFKLYGSTPMYFRLRGHGRFGHTLDPLASESSTAINNVGTGYKDIDCFFNVTAGEITIYSNSILLGTHSVTFDPGFTFDGISYAVTQTSGRMGELCVSLEDTRGFRIQQAKATAKGSVSDWNGDVDSVSTDLLDSRMMSTTGVGSGQTFEFEPMHSSVAGMLPEALIVSHASFAKSEADDPFVRHVFSDANTVKENSDLIKLDDLPNGNQVSLSVNPLTGDNWTVTSIQTIQAGLRNINQDLTVTVGTDGTNVGFDGVNGAVMGTFPDGKAVTGFYRDGNDLIQLLGENAGDLWDSRNTLKVAIMNETGDCVIVDMTHDGVNYVSDGVNALANNLIVAALTKTIRVFVLPS